MSFDTKTSLNQTSSRISKRTRSFNRTSKKESNEKLNRFSNYETCFEQNSLNNKENYEQILNYKINENKRLTKTVDSLNGSKQIIRSNRSIKILKETNIYQISSRSDQTKYDLFEVHCENNSTQLNSIPKIYSSKRSNLSINKFDLIRICIFLFIGHVHSQQAGVFPNQFNRGVVRSWRVEEILPINYNNQQPPMTNQSIAVQVDLNVKIKNIRLQLKEDKSTSLFVDLDMIQVWRDDRLQIPSALQLNPNPKITLDYRYKQAFWTPMLQLTNTKQVNLNTFFEPILFLEINNRKQVFLNAKLTLEVDCDYQTAKKHLHGDNKLERFGRTIGQFPFDSKECAIELISLSNTLDVISLRWSKFEIPISQINEFSVENKRNEHCVTLSDAGTFSCLRIRFKLKRQFISAFIDHMIPVNLFIIIAYFTFWIPCTYIPNDTNGQQTTVNLLNGHLIQARVLLLIYSLTALYWQKISDNLAFEELNNRTASITIWHFVNLIFVLIAIIEFILQLNQATVREFLLKKIIKDSNHLANLNSPNYGTSNNNELNRNSNPKTQSTKVQLNHNNLTNNGLDSVTTGNHQSIDTDNYKKIKNRNQIYLKILGLKCSVNNNRHQSSSQHIESDKENDSKHEIVDWLDHLFRIFYPLFYIAFLFLFLFITLIG